MMWYEVENGADERPAELDLSSSRRYVCQRRNITRVPASGEGDEFIPAHYRWEERKITKEDWSVQELLRQETALEDVYEALAELAGLLTEV
ncbi:MAG: hypothetical protein IJF88_10645 [Oscillospiraceae bacterium]|nr:hypothetical protein [Oscillospiraceae bacterium]